jgi:hypothetical protein
VEKKLKTLAKELEAMVKDSGSLDAHGHARRGADRPWRVLAEVGRASRSVTAYPGRAAGGNHVLHHRGDHTDPTRYPRPGPLPTQDRRRQDPHGGHALLEATDLSDAVYRQLLTDARTAQTGPAGAGPGGHGGATQESSAVDLPPHIDTSDQPLPGPAPTTLQPDPRPRKMANKQPLKTAG